MDVQKIIAGLDKIESEEEEELDQEVKTLLAEVAKPDPTKDTLLPEDDP